MRLARECDLVQPVFAMDHPRPFSTERRQCLSQLVDQVFAEHPDNLPRRARRITQRPKQIERRVNPQLPANARHSRRRTMKERRKHETDADLVQCVLRHERYRGNVHTERRQ